MRFGRCQRLLFPSLSATLKSSNSLVRSARRGTASSVGMRSEDRWLSALSCRYLVSATDGLEPSPVRLLFAIAQISMRLRQAALHDDGALIAIEGVAHYVESRQRLQASSLPSHAFIQHAQNQHSVLNARYARLILAHTCTYFAAPSWSATTSLPALCLTRC